MKSIGEISIAAARRAGFREFSSCESGNSAAAGASTELPAGEAGPTAPRASHTAWSDLVHKRRGNRVRDRLRKAEEERPSGEIECGYVQENEKIRRQD